MKTRTEHVANLAQPLFDFLKSKKTRSGGVELSGERSGVRFSLLFVPYGGDRVSILLSVSVDDEFARRAGRFAFTPVDLGWGRGNTVRPRETDEDVVQALSSLRRRIDEAFYGPKGVADEVRRLVQEAEVRGDKPTLRLVDLLRARVAGGEDVDDAERRRITEDALSSDTFPEFRKHRDALVASIWPSTPVTD